MSDRRDLVLASLQSAFDAQDQAAFAKLGQSLKVELGDLQSVLVGEQNRRKSKPGPPFNEHRRVIIADAERAIQAYVEVETQILLSLKTGLEGDKGNDSIRNCATVAWHGIFQPQPQHSPGLDESLQEINNFFDKLYQDTQTLLGILKDMLQQHCLALKHRAVDATTSNQLFDRKAADFQALTKAAYSSADLDCLTYLWLRHQMNCFQKALLKPYWYIETGAVQGFNGTLDNYTYGWRSSTKAMYRALQLPSPEDFFWTFEDASMLYNNTVKPDVTAKENKRHKLRST